MNIIILLFFRNYIILLFIFIHLLLEFAYVVCNNDFEKRKETNKKIMMSDGLHMWTNLLFRMRFIAFAFPIYFC